MVRSNIDLIGSEIVSLATLSLESLPRHATTATPLRPPSRYFSSLLLSLSFSLNWNETLSLSLFIWFSHFLFEPWLPLLYNLIWPFDFIHLWVCHFVYCKCFISLMFYVMLIGSYDSCLLSGGWLGATGPWGRIFELGKWTSRGSKG